MFSSVGVVYVNRQVVYVFMRFSCLVAELVMIAWKIFFLQVSYASEIYVLNADLLSFNRTDI